jgi:RNA polymerase sigma-70 factor, ECF subfamily
MVNTATTVEQLVAETKWLHRVALALVKDEAAADDLTQDTLVVAATEAPTDGRPLRPWLVRVLWNRVRMRTRGSKRRRAREERFGELAAAPTQPDEIVGRIELHRMLAGLVLELPVPQRDVLLLHFFEGLSSSQIGNRLGISAGTVRWRLKSAIDELRERLEKRAPNRAWVAPLAGLARTEVTFPFVFLAATMAVLAILALLFHVVSRHEETTGSATLSKQFTSKHGTTDRSKAGDPRAGSGAMLAAPTATDGTLGADHRRIEGSVVDRFDAPVEGADVELTCDYEAAVPKQHTGPSGAFAFDVDPECMFLIEAHKGGAHATISRRLMDGGPLTIKLHPLSLGVVRVVDAETGAPVADAAVTARGWFADEASTVTGADGVARLELLLPALVDVVATDYVRAVDVLEDPRHPSNHRMLKFDVNTVESATESHVEIKLSRGVLVSGTIVGPNGSAVPTAQVRVLGPTSELSPRPSTTRADASGRFELTVVRAGRYRLWAQSDDLTVTGPLQVDVAADGQTNVVAHLVTRPELHGTVVDAKFKPVEGARVSISDGSTRPGITDAKGHFSLRPEDDSPVDVIARLGTDSSAFQRVRVEYGKQTETLLQTGASGISGIAVDRDGSPVPGANVWLNGCCENNSSLVGSAGAIADANGKFTFNVPRGDYVLSVKRATDDDYEDDDDVKATGGSRDVKVIVP